MNEIRENWLCVVTVIPISHMENTENSSQSELDQMKSLISELEAQDT